MKNYKIKTLLIALLILSFSGFNSFAATKASQELTGQIISYDKCSDSQFPVTNAFDNNINTYFRSCAPFGNWIGLDLGEKCVITGLAYCPRVDSDYRDRFLGCIANSFRRSYYTFWSSGDTFRSSDFTFISSDFTFWSSDFTFRSLDFTFWPSDFTFRSLGGTFRSSDFTFRSLDCTFWSSDWVCSINFGVCSINCVKRGKSVNLPSL